MFCIKSNYSLYKEENFILLYVSVNEETKVVSLNALLYSIFFYAFKKITLNNVKISVLNAQMFLEIIGYLKSQEVFRLGIQKGNFCQFLI